MGNKTSTAAAIDSAGDPPTVREGDTPAPPALAQRNNSDAVTISNRCIGLSAACVVISMSLQSSTPGSLNVCLTGNRRWNLAVAYAFAVVFLYAIRLKRKTLAQFGKYRLVGTFNASLDLKDSFFRKYGPVSQHLRTWEVIGHLVTLVSVGWFLGDNKGLGKCGDESFQILMTIGITSYFICFVAEAWDGRKGVYVDTDSKNTETVPVEYSPTTAMALAAWVTFVAVINFGLTIARLHRAHMKDIVCPPSANATLALLFFLSTVIMVTYIGSYTVPNSRYRLVAKNPNTLVAIAGAVAFIMVVTQLGVYNTSGLKVSTYNHEYTGRRFCTFTNGTVAVTVDDTTTTFPKHAEDADGDGLLVAHGVTLIMMFFGTAFITFFVKKENATFMKKQEADRLVPRVAYPSGLRPADGASSLTRNRLTGDGKKPYASVSTLQFV
jgi:hypothetical protein